MIEQIVAWKEATVAFAGLEKDALHIHVSLLVLFGAALAFRRPLSSRAPWLAALLVALTGEAVDYTSGGYGAHWLGPAVHDLANTMFWPTLIWGLARFTRVRFR